PLPGKITAFPLRAGDVVIERTAGGGGYGDPLEREPEAVVRDVRFGYVSLEAARSVYGVVLDGNRIDTSATATLRAQLRDAGVVLDLTALHDEESDGSRRIVEIGSHAAQQLGAGD